MNERKTPSYRLRNSYARFEFQMLHEKFRVNCHTLQSTTCPPNRNSLVRRNNNPQHLLEDQLSHINARQSTVEVPGNALD